MNPELLNRLKTEKENIETQMLKVLDSDGGGGLQPLLAYWQTLNAVIEAASKSS
jgi:hypothetical protein